MRGWVNCPQAIILSMHDWGDLLSCVFLLQLTIALEFLLDSFNLHINLTYHTNVNMLVQFHTLPGSFDFAELLQGQRHCSGERERERERERAREGEREGERGCGVAGCRWGGFPDCPGADLGQWKWWNNWEEPERRLALKTHMGQRGRPLTRSLTIALWPYEYILQ